MHPRDTHRVRRATASAHRQSHNSVAASHAWLPAILGMLLILVLAGCGTSVPSDTSGVSVVAAENFWGSLASQLGGTRVHVTSIIADPNADPHSYEPTTQDARTVADARYVIANGAGYDGWMAKLLAANPVSGRVELDVGQRNGVQPGANPHLWYNPAYVSNVIDTITADLKRLDPAGAAYYVQRNTQFKTVALARYTHVILTIRATYAGTPVGATESIVVYLADALGLTLLTPPQFMKAISEGQEPTAADKAAADAQIRQGKIRVLLYNRQNQTPDTRALQSQAQQHGIPVVPVTETLVPQNTSFQDWQSGQLEALLKALGQAHA